MNTRQKIAALRAQMREQRIDAYYVPSTDPHQSEYVPAIWQRRAWLSGFTGSAGDVLVTRHKAGLWTDSRYFLQAEQQLDDSGIALFKLGTPGTQGLWEWAADQLRPGQTLGVDPQLLSLNDAENLERTLGERGIKVRTIAANLVDAIWKDRPAPGQEPIRVHGRSFAGETTAQKLARVRDAICERGARAHVLGALDAIAWLFNIRGRDVGYNPVVIAYAIVTEREAFLFVDPRKVGSAVLAAFGKDVKIFAYEELGRRLAELARRKLPVLLDPATTNLWVAERLGRAPIVKAESPVVAFKAVKNRVQMRGEVDCHVRDGVALVKFLKWLEPAIRRGGQTELSAADQLEEFRREGRYYQGPSFETISAYGPHGAVVHYAADKKSNTRLRPRGIYLIDSGGGYLDGTTDITRTVALGKPTPRQKDAFTRVLQGHIDVAMTPFPAGTSGQRLEMFARRPLWLAGLNYGHGTGHGVGHYLSVHEGPMGLTPRDVKNVPLRPGNLLSIEPGYYKAGGYGIRTENLAFVAEEPAIDGDVPWYRWVVISLCPIDRRLIEKRMLSPEQRDWLDGYHVRVYKTLAPELDAEHRAWLRTVTRPL